MGLDVYKLVAKQDGWYPVFERGKTQPVAYTKLNKGDVYKIGETKNFKKRYSEIALNNGVINKSKTGAFANIDGNIVPVGVEPIFVSEGKTKIEDQTLEKKLLKEYMDNNNELPAGNKICK
ncbi:hypothetical protein [Treponema pedis]|uniref:hypothetical protein n=1 Tax=Treponema pedis TaxID=409322 RepID=UPI002091CFE3|nr:hypothetical protein [Treponema pedis]